MNRRELFKGIAAGIALAVMPKAVKASAILPRAEVSFYEVAGQTIFPLGYRAGWLSSIVLCFPFIKHADGSMTVYRHDETLEQRVSTNFPGDIKSLEQRALRAFDEAYSCINIAMIETREDGCDFPDAGGIIRIIPRKQKEHYYAA